MTRNNFMVRYSSAGILIVMMVLFIAPFLTACREEGQSVNISKPDEYMRIFEADENTILRAIAQVLKDKSFGPAKIDYGNKVVETDFTTQDDWRSKSSARLKKINWKECEVTLSVITEKKTSSGWESRRLLEKSQYDNFFDAIELQVYNESYRVK
jgi:hypothetical protein